MGLFDPRAVAYRLAVATQVPAELELHQVDGQARSIEEWTTTFHLVLVVVDPFTYESSWILKTGRRVLRNFAEADCRVAWLATCTEAQARQFLGPFVDEFLVFADPDRELVKAMGVERLPTFVHLNQDHVVEAKAEGWDPPAWEEAVRHLAKVMSWSAPTLPANGDPAPYEGTPV